MLSKTENKTVSHYLARVAHEDSIKRIVLYATLNGSIILCDHYLANRGGVSREVSRGRGKVSGYVSCFIKYRLYFILH